jgi:RHS repeat-associated protein
VTTQYVRAGNIGGLLAKTSFASSSTGTTASTFFYHYDGSGNVAQLTDTSGATVAAYSYDAFGNTHTATGSQAASNLYRYQTKEVHASSGLYDFGFRFYSPSLGRWLNRDPLREDGGLHLYAAFANNPLAFADPYGLSNCGRFVGGIIGGMLGAFGGLPGAAFGTGVGSALGSLFDGKSLDAALFGGLTDGALAFAGGWAVGKLAGAIGSRLNPRATTDALLGARGGQLYPAAKLSMLEKFFERRGIPVKIGDEFLDNGQAAGFNTYKDGSAKFVFGSNPTQYEVWHELGHYLHWRGDPNFANYARQFGDNIPEQRVYDLLSNSSKRWDALSHEEQVHAGRLINEWWGMLR